MPVEAPNYEELVGELKLIRRKGITSLRNLELPALERAVRAAGMAEFSGESVTAPMTEEMLRVGLATLDGGLAGSAMSIAFGLTAGYRDASPSDLRKAAAQEMNLSVNHFRNVREPQFIGMLAEEILRIVHRNHLRLTALAMERRTPVATRLAISWLDRFEAMYRVWTPVSALGGDLSAYRSTLLEDPSVWQEAESADGANDGYSNEVQARGHMRSALASYCRFQLALQRFVIERGGLWLLSDSQAELELADSVYRIGWHCPTNDQDDSYLRIAYGERCRGEAHNFFKLIPVDDVLRQTQIEWFEWGESCECTWEVGTTVGGERFATHRHHADIDPKCWLHAVVCACSDFMALLDDDWARIADWYRIPATRPRPGLHGEGLYEKWGRM